MCVQCVLDDGDSGGDVKSRWLQIIGLSKHWIFPKPQGPLQSKNTNGPYNGLEFTLESVKL